VHCFELYFVRLHRHRKVPYANLVYIHIYIYIYIYISVSILAQAILVRCILAEGTAYTLVALSCTQRVVLYYLRSSISHGVSPHKRGRAIPLHTQACGRRALQEGWVLPGCIIGLLQLFLIGPMTSAPN